jgi:hypothetical protein
MPISDKQLAANRRNAQFSTGPRTPEGKERSSLNGFKHPELGLTALMVDEDREAQFEFVGEYLADLAPQGFHELQLARTIAMDSWHLNRIKAVEENIFAWGFAVEHSDCCSSEIPQVENAMIHAVSYMQYADRIDKISLYESRLSRTIARNIELLRKHQAERRNQTTQPEAAPAAEPRTQTAAVTSQTNQALTVENGFDRQDSQQSERRTVTPIATPVVSIEEPVAPGRAA